MYREVSLKERAEEGEYTRMEEAMREFVVKMYEGNLLKVLPEYSEEGVEGRENGCNCAVM